MKTFFFCALFCITLLNAAPTEHDLISAAKKGNVQLVLSLLKDKVPVNQAALTAAFDSGSVAVADLIFKANKDLIVLKKDFLDYCNNDHAEIARWILDHGTGKIYSDTSRLTISRKSCEE